MNVPALLEAIGSIAWPIIAALVLWRLFPLIKDITKSRGFTIKVGDMEVTVQEASEKVRLQIEDLQKKVSELRAMPAAAEFGRSVFTKEFQAQKAAVTKEHPAPTAAHVLWVDDNPENNAFEIARLRDDGVAVSEATSTKDALATLTAGAPIAAVITDLGRREHGSYRSRAGLDLIRAVRAAGMQTPVFVYTSPGAAPKIKDEVLAAGGSGATGSPVELFEFLHEALGDAA